MVFSESHKLKKQFPELFLSLLLAQSLDFITKTRDIAQSTTRLPCQPRTSNVLRVVADVLREILEVGFVWNLLVEFLRQV